MATALGRRVLGTISNGRCLALVLLARSRLFLPGLLLFLKKFVSSGDDPIPASGDEFLMN